MATNQVFILLWVESMFQNNNVICLVNFNSLPMRDDHLALPAHLALLSPIHVYF